MQLHSHFNPLQKRIAPSAAPMLGFPGGIMIPPGKAKSWIACIPIVYLHQGANILIFIGSLFWSLIMQKVRLISAFRVAQ
jgi:hypothetical protein